MKYRSWILVLSGMMALAACSPRQIPERKMKTIIEDIFLVNAYQSLHGAHNGLNMDSVDIYTPILESYGYDLADFRHTVDRWALQKSSKLSDLIDQAVAGIRSENEMHLARQAVQARLDSLITELYRDTLYRHPDPIRARNRRDLNRLSFTIAAAVGKYQVRYRYLIDSADRNNYVVMRYTLIDSADSTLLTSTRALTQDVVGWSDVAFDAVDGVDSLEVILADYPDATQAVSFRADSVYLVYDQPIEVSRKHYLSALVRLVLGVDYPYERTFPAQDSGALHVVPPLRPDPARRSDL